MSLKTSHVIQKRKLLVTILTSGFGFACPLLVRAQIDLGMDFAETLGLPDTDIRLLIGGIARSLLGLMGFVMVLLVLASGFKYMTHGNNEEAKTAAIGGIKNAVIGLTIMMMSFSLAKFIIGAVADAASTI